MRKRPVPKSMPRKETEDLLRELKQILESSQMKSTSFNQELIEETRLFRNTYISDPLSEMINRYEDFLSAN